MHGFLLIYATELPNRVDSQINLTHSLLAAHEGTIFVWRVMELLHFHPQLRSGLCMICRIGIPEAPDFIWFEIISISLSLNQWWALTMPRESAWLGMVLSYQGRVSTVSYWHCSPDLLTWKHLYHPRVFFSVEVSRPWNCPNVLLVFVFPQVSLWPFCQSSFWHASEQ